MDRLSLEYHLDHFQVHGRYTPISELRRYLLGFREQQKSPLCTQKSWAYYEARAKACELYIKERETERLLLGE